MLETKTQSFTETPVAIPYIWLFLSVSASHLLFVAVRGNERGKHGLRIHRDHPLHAHTLSDYTALRHLNIRVIPCTLLSHFLSYFFGSLQWAERYSTSLNMDGCLQAST
jgi:hypothetical protein